jgi:hypothetical protein
LTYYCVPFVQYHPKPRISLSQALPVGIESTCETMTIEAGGSLEMSVALMQRINGHLPRGMRILDVPPQSGTGFGYLLVGRSGLNGEAVLLKEKNGKSFYIWRGNNAKELWLSGDFARIVKIENRRIDGVRADN